jgi:hypothetical protein
VALLAVVEVCLVVCLTLRDWRHIKNLCGFSTTTAMGQSFIITLYNNFIFFSTIHSFNLFFLNLLLCLLFVPFSSLLINLPKVFFTRLSSFITFSFAFSFNFCSEINSFKIFFLFCLHIKSIALLICFVTFLTSYVAFCSLDLYFFLVVNRNYCFNSHISDFSKCLFVN